MNNVENSERLGPFCAIAADRGAAREITRTVDVSAFLTDVPAVPGHISIAVGRRKPALPVRLYERLVPSVAVAGTSGPHRRAVNAPGSATDSLAAGRLLLKKHLEVVGGTVVQDSCEHVDEAAQIGIGPGRMTGLVELRRVRETPI